MRVSFPGFTTPASQPGSAVKMATPPSLHLLLLSTIPTSSTSAVVEPAPVPVGTLVSRAGGSILLISPLPYVRLYWLPTSPPKGRLKFSQYPLP